MEVLKKLLMAIGVLALVFVIITVTIFVLNQREKEDVMQTVNTAFDALKNYDFETLGKYMNTDAIVEETSSVLKTQKNESDEVKEKDG